MLGALSSEDLTEDIFWQWAALLTLPDTFYGRIVAEVKAGRIEVLEVTAQYRRSKARPPPVLDGRQAGLSRKSRATE